FRQFVYSLFALIAALQQVWHFIPKEYDAQIMATLTIVGGALALGNTGTPATTTGPNPPEEG
ncbi:MAG: hypothetical protein HY828_18380, partial [Actinobacteria bacterium]|nr:hypothetical protein [Actinomycetota bacterium]